MHVIDATCKTLDTISPAMPVRDARSATPPWAARHGARRQLGWWRRSGSKGTPWAGADTSRRTSPWGRHSLVSKMEQRTVGRLYHALRWLVFDRCTDSAGSVFKRTGCPFQHRSVPNGFWATARTAPSLL